MKLITVPAVDKMNFAPIRKLIVSGVNISFGHQISRGAFSTVYKATDDWNNNLVVKVYLPNIKSTLWKHEAAMLRLFSSRWVVPLHHSFEHDGQGYLVMENVGSPIGQLNYNYDRCQIVKHVARWLLSGIHLLHSSGYVHNDINPQNVLLQQLSNSKLGAVRIIDFAFVCKVKELEQTKKPMALWIPPPEYYDIAFGKRGFGSDIYHAALILMQLAIDRPLKYEASDCLSDMPAREAKESEIKVVRALAAALNTESSLRPTAVELWRAIKQIEP